MQAIVNEAVTKSAPIANRQVGTITADIVKAAAPSGESPLGNLIADSQLAATRLGRRADRADEPRRGPRRPDVRVVAGG